MFQRQVDNLKGFASMAGGSFKDAFTGRIFLKDIVKNQWGVIVVVVIILFCHIGLRFSCEDQVKQIDRLKKELEDVKLEALSRSSDLLGISKQSQIELLVAEVDSSLVPSVVPPFVISK